MLNSRRQRSPIPRSMLVSQLLEQSVLNFRCPASLPRLCVQEISNEYWCFPGLNPEGSDEMTKESYLKLNRKLHLALVSCGWYGWIWSWRGLSWVLPLYSVGSRQIHRNRLPHCRSSEGKVMVYLIPATQFPKGYILVAMRTSFESCLTSL